MALFETGSSRPFLPLLFLLLAALALTATDAVRAKTDDLGERSAPPVLGDEQCTSEDEAKIVSKGSGNDENSFPGLAAGCGKSSWGIIAGWQHDKYTSCLEEKVGVSLGCSQCFSDAGEYGFQNCKVACLRSWCSSSCLSCTEKAKQEVIRCAGFVPPDAETCDKPDPEPAQALEAELREKTAGVEPANGDMEGGETLGCSEEDKTAMELAGPGNSAASFPSLAAKCGKEAFSMFRGWQEQKYKDCLHDASGISLACTDCFEASGRYGLANCKVACLFSWCSEGCLSCIGGHKPVLHKCIGFTPPEAAGC